MDTRYPYPAPSYTEGEPQYQTNDSPYEGLDNTAYSVTIQDSFTDYLMYQAPGSTQWVPRATFTWSTNGAATIPGTGGWANYATTNGSNVAGTVSPSTATNATPVNFAAGKGFPSWTQINVFPDRSTWPKAP